MQPARQRDMELEQSRREVAARCARSPLESSPHADLFPLAGEVC
jgi:hypothetical protein